MKVDLHMHSTYSDGIDSPEDMVRTAIEKGIQCICLTDHDEIKGAVRAMKFAYDKDILVVPGIELVSTSGDVLGINVKKKIPSGLSIEETIKEIRKQGGIAVIPHPFNKPLNNFWGGEKVLKRAGPDAIEVFNASVLFGFANRKALNFSKENKFFFTAGSDAHRKEYIGRGFIEIEGKVRSEKDLIEAIMSGRGKTGGKILGWFEFIKNGAQADVAEMIRYYRLKRRNGKKLKIAKL
jgi:hypothetical protein